MQWQTAPARWRVLFGKVAEKYRAGGRMQTEYADKKHHGICAAEQRAVHYDTRIKKGQKNG
jgi:hypothetical protein